MALNEGTLRVVIVDDDIGVTGPVADQLRTRGHRLTGVRFVVREADSLEYLKQFLEIDRGFIPDIFLVDVNFEKTGGAVNEGVDRILPFLTSLKTLDDAYAGIRTVVYTANTDEQTFGDVRRQSILGHADEIWAKEALYTNLPYRLVALAQSKREGE